jgi:hypothetical protein
MTVNKINQPIAPVAPSSAPSSSGEVTPSTSRKLSANPLFQSSSFSASTSTKVVFDDGTSIAIPNLTHSDLKQAGTLFGGMSDEKLKALQAAGLSIAQAFKQATFTPVTVDSLHSATATAGTAGATGGAATALRTTTSALVSGGVPNTGEGPQANIASPQLTQSITSAASAYQQASGGSGGYDNTVQAVTFMGVQGLQQDLTNYAKQVQHNLNAKKGLEVQAQDIQNALAAWPAGTQTQQFQITSFDQFGNPTTKTMTLDQTQAKSALDGLQSGIMGYTDQNQVDQLNLQQMSENYSQGLSTISNILKMNFDTVKGIIGNIRT